MDEEKTRSELRDNFPGIDEEAIVQCMSLCRMFNKTPEDLKYKWEAMIYNTSVKDQPIAFFTVNSARDLQQLLQREVGKTGQAKVAAKKATGARKIIRNTVLGGPSAGFSTPSATRRRMVDVKVEPATPSLRTNAQAPTGLPVNFSPPQNLESYSYRYMHEKIHDRAAILDEQIDNIAELVRQHYKLEELSDPSAGTPDEVVVVGRIVNDGDTKLGESSTLLESSRMMGTGARVPLEFNADLKIRCASTRGTGSTGIGLFPGMIVALKGKNGSGDSFVVSEILRIPPLPSNSKSEDNVSLKAIVACGPFTFDSDLDYKPFAAIIETARNEQPDLLLLLGPFVSSNHPLIKIGHIDMTPASLFRERISKPLVQLEADAPETVVVIVPSPHDLITSHLVLPQSAIERDPELGLPRRCQLVPNPSIFSVNGFSIGAISVDVLFHIRKDLFSKQAQEISDEPSREPADPMSMLCRQILEQQSFYPLFPVPKEVQEDVNLSVVHSDLLKIKEVAPDILILPSKLKEFHKVVDSTLVINPALAAKFNSAGSAAWLSVTRSAGAAPQHNMKIVKLGT